MPLPSKKPAGPAPIPSGSRGIPIPLVLLVASIVLCVGIVAGVMLRGDSGRSPGDDHRARAPIKAPIARAPGPNVMNPAAKTGPGPEAVDPSRVGPRNPSTSKVNVPANLKTPQEMLDILRQAIHANDVDAMNAIDAMLKQYVAGDPARAREIMELFKHESEPSILEIMAGALLADPKIANDPDLVQGFLGIAKDDRNSDRRGQALLFLSGVTDVSPQLVGDIIALARAETDMQVRIGGIAALTRYMESHKEFAGQINDTFIEIARTDKDETVRGTAIQSLNIREATPQTIDAINQLFRSEQAPGVRAVIAMMYGDVHPGQRQSVMSQLEQAFTSEQEKEVKRAMITSVVRAGREEAIATLERMRTADPKYQDDVNDYLEILRTGERDMDKIWDQKFQREQARGDVSVGDEHEGDQPDGGQIPGGQPPAPESAPPAPGGEPPAPAPGPQ